MAHQSELIASDIHAYLKTQEEKGMLRFITCGSVDDGKSTLIGRLLWDSKMVFEDQLAALEADSRRVGTQGEKVDYALLLDGLQAEREQGITIDVAYRFFSTDKRKFIVADTPGHEQYTRNMVTGASTAQVAVILIDARKGVLTQTRRHSYLVSLVGIRHVILAINKMDLVDYSAERFAAIRQEYENFAAGLGFDQIAAIPISALEGDNVLARSEKTPWHQGPTLMEYLETVQVADAAVRKPFRMRVQWVNRPNLDFRGFCGTIASGAVRPGDDVVVTSSGQVSRVKRIVTMDGDLEKAVAGQAITLTLADEIDISRGDTLAATDERPYHADRLEAKVVWMHEEPLAPGRSYLLKAGSSTAPAQVVALKFKVNVNSLKQESGETLELNEVGVCTFSMDRPVSFDSYRENRGTGNFILIDRFTNATVGAGMIHQPLLQSAGDQWSKINVDRQARAERKGQKPRILWFSGSEGVDLPAIAALVEKRLHSLGRHTYLLDGVNLNRALNDADTADGNEGQHIRRIAEVARLFAEAGLVVLTSCASSGEDSRSARKILAGEVFTEIFVEIPPEASGRQGTGDDASSIFIDGVRRSGEDLAEEIVRKIDFSAKL
jgi:bifunctional enzyme CysN/CysC